MIVGTTLHVKERPNFVLPVLSPEIPEKRRRPIKSMVHERYVPQCDSFEASCLSMRKLRPSGVVKWTVYTD